MQAYVKKRLNKSEMIIMRQAFPEFVTRFSTAHMKGMASEAYEIEFIRLTMAAFPEYEVRSSYHLARYLLRPLLITERIAG